MSLWGTLLWIPILLVIAHNVVCILIAQTFGIGNASAEKAGSDTPEVKRTLR